QSTKLLALCERTIFNPARHICRRRAPRILGATIVRCLSCDHDSPSPLPIARPEAVETGRAFGRKYLTSICNNHIIVSRFAGASSQSQLNQELLCMLSAPPCR